MTTRPRRRLRAKARIAAPALAIEMGDLVPPGHYFLRLKVESDARSQSVSRMVSIVY